MALVHLPEEASTAIKYHNAYVQGHTVEPPNNGHIGDGSLVLCREVVPISEVVPERVWLRKISH